MLKEKIPLPIDYKQIFRAILIILLVGYLFADFASQTTICRSNIERENRIGMFYISLNQFNQYETDKVAKCSSGFTLSNSTFDCQQKDYMNCTTDMSLYTVPWRR